MSRQRGGGEVGLDGEDGLWEPGRSVYISSRASLRSQ